MLTQGTWLLPDQSNFTVYIVEIPGFYRLDITESGSEFHIYPEKVLYSRVVRRNTYEYGDTDLYKQFMEIMQARKCVGKSPTVVNAWEDGVFITKSTIDEPTFYHQSVKHNGKYFSDTTAIGQEALVFSCINPEYELKMEPLNFYDYNEIFVGKTIKESYDTPYIPLDVLRKKYDISHIEKKDCVVANTLELARTRLKHWADSPAPIKGFDTETTGVDFCLYGEDKLVGIILAEDVNTSTYYPFRHEEFENLPMEFLEELMAVVKPQEKRLVAQNKKFDRKVMLSEGYDLLIEHDTFILALILDPIIKKGSHALKSLMFMLNGLKFLELDEIFTSAKLINFAKLPIDIVKVYACPDGYNVIELWYDQWKKLPKYQRALYRLECKLADLKADQEYYGMRVDVKKYEEQYDNCNYVIDTLLKMFHKLTHCDGNINSPILLNELIYNKMRCKVLMRTKTGKPSTSAAAIKKLASIKRENEAPKQHDVVDKYGNVVISAEKLEKAKYPALVVLEKYREYNKRKTAFYARFERTMKTGRIFFWVNQMGASSGRQSSPMHQLPPELKAVILSDYDNRQLWGPDYSQVELRMMAYLAQERDLIELCKNPDNDIHRIIGSLISGLEMWEITAQMRYVGKRRNFGVVYLISEYGLAGQMYGPGYTKEQVQYCKEQLQAFFKRFKRINRVIQHNARFIQEKGYMQTKHYNRKRPFPEILEPDITAKRKAALIRQGNNMPVQGTCADMMKAAEVNFYYYIREKGWNKLVDGIPMVRIMLSIHDEVLISAHESIPKEEIIEMIKLCMEIPVKDAPPFFVAPALMDNWEGHSDDSLAIPIRYRDKLISDYNKSGVSVFKDSKYKIVVPQDIKNELLDKRYKSKKALVKEYLDKVSWEFISGNNGNTLTEKGKKTALLRYLESGFETYIESNYVELLETYRDIQLRDYMNDLILKYGHDYKVVSTKVRHPSLTHELIARFSKEIKNENPDMPHIEQIEFATKCYIDGVDITEHEEIVEESANNNEQMFIELEELVEFDKDGNLVETGPIEEEDDAWSIYDDEEYIEAKSSEKIQYVWEMVDCIIADLDSLTKEQGNEVIKDLYKYKATNGFFKVNMIFGNVMYDTGFRIENIDLNVINEKIERMVLNNESLHSVVQ